MEEEEEEGCECRSLYLSSMFFFFLSLSYLSLLYLSYLSLSISLPLHSLSLPLSILSLCLLVFQSPRLHQHMFVDNSIIPILFMQDWFMCVFVKVP